MEGLLHYINPAHAISLLSALNEERLKGQLCDVLLIVGDQKFRAHKNVLAASSEYFQSLFTNKENESQTVFQLDFCEPDAFDNVLNYIYSSSLFVEKGSLAAVQELGYSLGISFLTNIVSKTPQAPFPVCPNRKTVFIEHDENSSQKRSVIVCQSKNEAQGKTVSQNPPDASHSPRLSPSIAVKANAGKPHVPKATEPLHSLSSAEKSWPRDASVGYAKSLERSGSLEDPSRSILVRRTAALPSTPLQDREAADEKPGGSGQLPKGKAIELALKRPRPPVLSLRSSSETPYLLKETSRGSIPGEDRNLLYYSRLGLVIPSGGSATANQSIDRSGPLVKSLLRRSLSMDSQVPACSPSVEPRSSQGLSSVPGDTPGNVFCALSQKSSLKDGGDKLALDERPPAAPPHRLRSFSASQSLGRDGAEARIKTEPRSPLADPSDIIRVTVGDATAAASGTRDLSLKMEDDQKDMSRLPAKRRFQADRRLPPKKLKVDAPGHPAPEDGLQGGPGPALLGADSPQSDSNKDEFGELEGTRPNKKFKCKHCLKIFRSTAGLHRHANMYHNPEKPYACDICHKRFHTNFKVWTHCQTQHGIVKNPSPASSSHAVLDEKFQRKLIDIVREREIKKALFIKLRRSKPGFQGQSGSQAQAIKRNLRSRAKGAYVCTYCGKAYRFLSQFKQHIKMHPGEKPLGGPRAAKPREPAALGPAEATEVFQCRLCNAKLSSLLEQGSHERLCRSATVCPYCSLRLFSPELKREHESTCEYRKLTCLECMRTFKSSFSIWRHQVEVHNQNTMAPAENLSLPGADHNGEATGAPRPPAQPEPPRANHVATAKDDGAFSDCSEQVNFDSEDSSCLPEDLSLSKQLKILVKEEPVGEAEGEAPEVGAAPQAGAAAPSQDPGLWPCEKCGKAFPAHRQLERHQELLCSVKPFICHVCNKAFRTNFRLWSHFQSHTSQAAEDPAHKEPEVCPVPANSPSPPPLPPPPPLPKIQPLEPDSPTGLSENSAPAPEKLFVPQESDTLFHHAPPLSAITFKRQFMCTLCHRTFKTAFSLWSHEQTHN